LATYTGDWRKIFATCLVSMAFLFLTQPRCVSAQPQGVEVSFAGLSGVNTVAPGGEILVYAVELRDSVPADGRIAMIGGTGGVGGILITLTDRLASGIVAADFNGLKLYRSTDGILDGGDTFLRTEAPVVIGGALLVDFVSSRLRGVRSSSSSPLISPSVQPLVALSALVRWVSTST
jgi:hypothetical protein